MTKGGQRGGQTTPDPNSPREDGQHCATHLQHMFPFGSLTAVAAQVGGFMRAVVSAHHLPIHVPRDRDGKRSAAREMETRTVPYTAETEGRELAGTPVRDGRQGWWRGVSGIEDRPPQPELSGEMTGSQMLVREDKRSCNSPAP